MPKASAQRRVASTYLFDRPGISVENSIGVVEDDFRFWPFVVDMAFYGLLLAALVTIGGQVRSWREEG